MTPQTIQHETLFNKRVEEDFYEIVVGMLAALKRGIRVERPIYYLGESAFDYKFSSKVNKAADRAITLSKPMYDVVVKIQNNEPTSESNLIAIFVINTLNGVKTVGIPTLHDFFHFCCRL